MFGNYSLIMGKYDEITKSNMPWVFGVVLLMAFALNPFKILAQQTEQSLLNVVVLVSDEPR